MEITHMTQSVTVHDDLPRRRKRPKRDDPRPTPRFQERKQIFHDLVRKLLEGYDSPEDQFRRILEARGFLLEEIPGRISLSDNSSFEDFRSLDTMLSRYNLGHFSRKGENVPRDDRCCEYERWVRARGGCGDEIVLTKEPTFEDLLSVFAWCEGFGGSTISRGSGGGRVVPDKEFFYHREHGLKVPVKVLEPGIARYLKSLSACGVTTSLSCDGHSLPLGTAWVKFNNSIDRLWFQLIMEGVVFPVLKPQLRLRYQIKRNEGYKDVEILLRRKPTEAYLELQRVAAFLYEHRLVFRNLKNNICSEYEHPSERLRYIPAGFDRKSPEFIDSRNEPCFSWLKGCRYVDKPLLKTEMVRMRMLECFGNEGGEAIEWIRSGCRRPRRQRGVDRCSGTKKGTI